MLYLNFMLKIALTCLREVNVIKLSGCLSGGICYIHCNNNFYLKDQTTKCLPLSWIFWERDIYFADNQHFTFHVALPLNLAPQYISVFCHITCSCGLVKGWVPLGWSGSGSVIQDLSGSWCIKRTNKSYLPMDSPVPLMHHDPDRS